MTTAGNPPAGGPPSRSDWENALPIGTHVSDFEIVGVVGEGGFGIVYEAFDHSLHRRVALKEYMPSALASRRGDFTVAVRSQQHEPTFRAGLRSFVNEARLLAQFDHPALVKVFRFWEQNETAYMVMPLYEGRTLKDVLRETPRPEEGWLRSILAPLLDALEVMHAEQCYHRDIAPDNILILKNGAPLLLDFGAARRIIGDMTQAVTVILKPGFAPIEQYADDASLQQGPWTDIYALSAVFCLAITGKPPSTSVTRMVSDPMRPLTETVPGYSREFLAALDRGLAVRPEQRPQSVAEFRQLLGIRTWAPPAVTQIGARQRLGGSTPEEPDTASDETTKMPAMPLPPAQSSPRTTPPAVRTVSTPAPGPIPASNRRVPQASIPKAPQPSAGSRGPGTAGLPPSSQGARSPAAADETVNLAAGSAAVLRSAAESGRRATSFPRWMLVVAGVGALALAGLLYGLMGGGSPDRSTTPVSRPEASQMASGKVAAEPTRPAAPAAERAVQAPPGGVDAQSPPPAVAAERKPTEVSPAVSLPTAPPPRGAEPVAAPSTPPAPAPVAALPQLAPPAPVLPAPSDPIAASAGDKAGPAPSLAPQAPVALARGRVNLAIKPWGGIYVNGQAQGVTPPKKFLDLPEGRYTIEIRNTGFPSHIREVEVRSGRNVTISHTFQ